VLAFYIDFATFKTVPAPSSVAKAGEVIVSLYNPYAMSGIRNPHTIKKIPKPIGGGG
jgi:hypothetical protein